MTNSKTAAKTPDVASASPTGATEGPTLVGLDSAVFGGVMVKLDAQLGSVSMTVASLLALRAGDVVTLDSQLNDTVSLYLAGALVGRGEIVAVEDSFGVRIVDISNAS